MSKQLSVRDLFQSSVKKPIPVEKTTSPSVFDKYNRIFSQNKEENTKAISLISDDDNTPEKSNAAKVLMSLEDNLQTLNKSLSASNQNGMSSSTPSTGAFKFRQTAKTSLKFESKIKKSENQNPQNSTSTSNSNEIAPKSLKSSSSNDSKITNLSKTSKLRTPAQIIYESDGESIDSIPIKINKSENQNPQNSTLTAKSNEIAPKSLKSSISNDSKITNLSKTSKLRTAAQIIYESDGESNDSIPIMIEDRVEEVIKPKVINQRTQSIISKPPSMDEFMKDINEAKSKNVIKPAAIIKKRLNRIVDSPSPPPEEESIETIKTTGAFKPRFKSDLKQNETSYDEIDKLIGYDHESSPLHVDHQRRSSTSLFDVLETKPSPVKISPVSAGLASLRKPDFNKTIAETQQTQDKSFSINLDDSIISEVENAVRNPDVDSWSIQRLKEEKLKVLEKYYNIYSQIPLSYFASIQGFSQTTIIKLKMGISSFEGKIKRKIRHDEEMKKSMTKLNSSSPAVQIIENSVNDQENHEDQFNIEEIFQDFEENKQKEAGKSNRYVDLTNTPVNVNNFTAFKPRVNMASSSLMPSPKPSTAENYNTDYVENFETDLDGFPIIDYSQLRDVTPSTSQPSTSSRVQRTSKVNPDSLESMIPKADTKISVSPSKQLGSFQAGFENDATTGQFDGRNYPFSAELLCAFKYTFGLKEFRTNQLQAINAVMLGNDVFILMPTGGGKSLCYQLPAVVSSGITIVVSPLKSLIFDQVNKLKLLGIESSALTGEISNEEAVRIYSDISSATPAIKLLYITPEKISASEKLQSIFNDLHKRNLLARIVIDEAHCVSTWGHDFRPDYKRLGEFKTRYPNVPVMALTATANPRVRVDVVNQLKMKNCKWFCCSFNRPNLKYIVLQKTGGAKTINDIILLIKREFSKSSGIVYCLSRKDCEGVAEKLQLSNIKAAAYHAGLSDKKREEVQRNWITDKYRVVVATIAFGMGIDKPDVRFVIHYSIPKSIEGYYQESGRAGRDGDVATCIMYYNYSDKIRYVNMFNKENAESKNVSLNNLDLIVSFCENKMDCRRTLQLNYFGEIFSKEECLKIPATACDNCSRVTKFKEIDATSYCRNLVSSVNDLCMDKWFTVLQMVDVFKGAETKKIVDFGLNRSKYHGEMKTWDRSDIQRLFHKLLELKYLKEEVKIFRDIPQNYIKVGPKCAELMNSGSSIKVMFAITEKNQPTSSRAKKLEVSLLDQQKDELRDNCYHDLVEAISEYAGFLKITVNQVINMQALVEMSKKLPVTKTEMLTIPHVTNVNYEKFGEKLLEITKQYAVKQEFLTIDDSQYDDDDEEMGSSQSQNQDWSAIGRKAASSSAGGFKRKSTGGWGGFQSKRYKKTPTRKRKTPTKKKKSPAKKKKSPAKKAPAKRNHGLLPVPKPKF